MKTRQMIFLAILSSILWISCKGKNFQAIWVEKAIEIDGDTVDWQGDLIVLEAPPVGIGAKQDSAYLYLCFVTQDESLKRQITGQGMVLWMEADGEGANKIGIKYPTGMMKGSFHEGMPERGNPPAMIFDDLAIKLPEMEDFESYRPVELEGLGISAMIKESGGLWVYELKIPLTSKDAMTVALANERPGKVNLVFEGREMERKNSGEDFGGSRGPGMGGGPGGGRPPGGMGGGGGMPGRGRPGGGPGGGPGESGSFKLKCNIVLETQQ